MSFNSEYSKNDQISDQAYYHLKVSNLGQYGIEFIIDDKVYGNSQKSIHLSPNGYRSIIIPTEDSYGWYDFSVSLKGNQNFLKRYAGRIEMGKAGITDPLMGNDLTEKIKRA
ncbi:MAG: phospholipase domain-containing protein [Cyclobacteriaceae bacterium]